MYLLILSSLISGGTGMIGSIASSIIGASAQAKAAQKQFEYQKELNQMQNDYNTEMWEKNNEYNTSSNVLQRYLDTGMNAGAAVQAMSGVQGISSAPQASSSPGIPVDIASGIQAGSNAFGKSLESLLQGALLDKTKAETQEIQTNTDYKKKAIPIEIQNLRADFNQKMANISAKILSLDKIKAETQKIQSETSGQDIDNMYKGAEHAQGLQIGKATLQEIGTEIAKMNTDMRNDTMRVKIAGYDSSTKRQEVMVHRDNMALQRELAGYQIRNMEKLGIKLTAETRNLYEDMLLKFYSGQDKKAEALLKQFELKVKEYNGHEWYADKEKLNAIRSFIPLTSFQ